MNVSLRHAQTLTLRSTEPSRHRGEISHTYVLSSALLPNLTHLVLECRPGHLHRDSRSLKSLDLPKLVHLTLRATSMTSVETLSEYNLQPHQRPDVYDMIDALQSLRHLTIVNLIVGPWDSFLTHTRSKSLYQLDIELEDSFYDASMAHLKAKITIPEKATLFATATRVQLSYEYRMLCEIAWSHHDNQMIVVGSLRGGLSPEDFHNRAIDEGYTQSVLCAELEERTMSAGNWATPSAAAAFGREEATALMEGVTFRRTPCDARINTAVLVHCTRMRWMLWRTVPTSVSFIHPKPHISRLHMYTPRPTSQNH